MMTLTLGAIARVAEIGLYENSVLGVTGSSSSVRGAGRSNMMGTVRSSRSSVPGIVGASASTCGVSERFPVKPCTFVDVTCIAT
jgi:hypothetical protein